MSNIYVYETLIISDPQPKNIDKLEMCITKNNCSNRQNNITLVQVFVEKLIK